MEHNPYNPPSSNVDVAAAPAAGELASRKDRLLAALIDSIILMVILMPAFYFMGVFEAAGESFGMLALTALTGFGVYVAVNGHFLARYGQTVGKRQMKIRIVSVEGEPVSLGRILLARQLPIQMLTMVPLLGNLVGLVDSLFIFRDDRRCLHDLIAGTKVVNTGA